MTHVFSLQATGIDGLSLTDKRVITTTTVFATEALAKSRKEAFVAKILERFMLDGKSSIEVKVIPHEVIYG